MPIDTLFLEIDRDWPDRPPQRIQLRVIGSTALMLQTGYERGTKDGDVLETAIVTGPTKERLLALAGKGTRLHDRHRIYLDVVANGVPFLPCRPLWHSLAELNVSLRTFEIEVLNVVDVVVSKLKRFHSADQGDVMAMIALDRVPHARLISRFREAVDLFSGDARAEDLPRYVRNLHRVERDMLGVPETDIELPEWI